MVNAYNFMVAADPALSTFAQSSPFYQGKFIGKDARALIWRGDRDLKFSPTLHGTSPQAGELPPYQHTGTDLINFTEKAYQYWIDFLLNRGIAKKDIPTYKSKLATNWTTLRISHHGTLEQRSMDINTPLIVLALARVIQNIMRAIQENFIKVYVSDQAVDEPFKYLDKSILIPPYTYVKTELQRRALFKGLEDEKIFQYCKRLLWLAKEFGSPADADIFEPLEKMLQTKKTVSDDIISLAKKLGHKKLDQPLANDIAAQIALTYSNKLFKEMVLFRELVKRQVNNGK